MKIILGSSSKYRKSVLEKAGYQFETMSPDIDEKAIRTKDYYQLPLLIARAKAAALTSRVSEPAILIASDQVVVCNNDLHEKPSSVEEARSFLQKYNAGHPPETVSAVVVVNTRTGKRAEGVDIAKCFFKPMPAEVMETFIKEGDPFSKAGGFSIQSDIMGPYLEKMEGTIDSVMGMPLALLEKLIKEVEA